MVAVPNFLMTSFVGPRFRYFRSLERDTKLQLQENLEKTLVYNRDAKSRNQSFGFVLYNFFYLFTHGHHGGLQIMSLLNIFAALLCCEPMRSCSMITII